ncbi:MAG: Holliday junction branch migration protein RuvA [bacterium]
MYSYVKGELVEKGRDRVVVETAGGVGFELHIVESERPELPQTGQEVRMFSHLYVREDKMRLYGFVNRSTRDFFRKLLPQKGIGPSMAVNILSGMGPDKFRRAIHNQDVEALQEIHGVGKKTARRLIVEMAEKLPLEPGSESQEEDPVVEEAIEALMGLGFGKEEADSAVRKTASGAEYSNVEELIQATFSRLEN